MLALIAYVEGRAPIIVFNIMLTLGFSSADRNNVLSMLTGALNSGYAYLITIPLAVIVYLYDIVNNIGSILPQWIIDADNFIFNTVQPFWSYVYNGVTYLLYVADNLTASITTTANHLIVAAFAAWADALSFADWLSSNYRMFLAGFLSNPAGYVLSVFSPILSAAFSPVLPLLDYWSKVIGPAQVALSAFLANPLNYIEGYARSWFSKEVADIEAAQSFFTWWINTGIKFLVELVNDPVKVILDVLAPTFIQWLMQLIADNW